MDSTLDGNGNTLTISGWTAGAGEVGVDCAVTAEYGGTIKDIVIDGGRTGVDVNIGDAEAELTLDNVTIENSIRAIHAYNVSMDLVVKNSVLAGKVSHETRSATFTNVTFNKNSNGVKDDELEPWTDTVLVNCNFETGYALSLTDLRAGELVTLTNCRVNGELVTAGNAISLLGLAGGTDGEIIVDGTPVDFTP